MNFKKTAITTAITAGTLAGSFTLASALTPTDTAPPTSAVEQTADDDTNEVADPFLGGSITAPQAEGVNEADEAAGLEGLATVTADEATGAALAANPGATLVDVSLENENGSVVYEVTLSDAAGTNIEVKVDAGNAAVLDQETGDNEADEADEVSDEGDDGIDHEFDGEETGENGDGVSDADDALEAQEATTGNRSARQPLPRPRSQPAGCDLVASGQLKDMLGSPSGLSPPALVQVPETAFPPLYA